MSRDADEASTNLSTNARIEDIVAERRLSRRSVLAGGLGMGALSIFGSGLSALLSACGDNITRSRAVPTPARRPTP